MSCNPCAVRSDIQMDVIVRKAFLNRQDWEEGMRLLGRQPDWDRLPRCVVTHASQGRLPDALAPLVEQAMDPHVHGETNREIASGGEDWRVFALPLLDASGRDVGDLWVMRDITAEKAAFARQAVRGVSAGEVLLAVMLGFIYVLLRRTDAGIRARRRNWASSGRTSRPSSPPRRWGCCCWMNRP